LDTGTERSRFAAPANPTDPFRPVVRTEGMDRTGGSLVLRPAIVATAGSGGAPGVASERSEERGRERMQGSETTSPDDARLVAAVAAGDRDALAALYDRHTTAMFAVAQRLLRSRQDAEDLLHDVWVETWRRAGDYDSRRGSVRSWLLLRVRSRGIDRLRALEAARRHAMAQEHEAQRPRVAHAAWDAPDCTRARSALADLPAEQRALVEAAYFEGMSCSELAARFEIPLGTVKSRLSAGVDKLRRSFAASGTSRS
jgi:RNA polymerase sigma-70 factor (ECF subfamily)